MGRIFSLLLALALALALLPACRQEPALASSEPMNTAPLEPPTPAPTPDLATGMERVKNVLIDYCSDELAELEGYSVFLFGVGDFPQLIEGSYGIDASLVTDGFVVEGAGDSLFRLAAVEMIDDDSMSEYRDAFSNYDSNLIMERLLVWNEDRGEYVFPKENLQEYQDLRSHSTWGSISISRGEFLCYVHCQNPQGANQALTSAIMSLPDEQSPAEPQATPQPLEVAEGIFFIDISSPDVKGEPDPDHPGRARYVQPNEEDMSLYDTSAILAAWEKGDPAGLSGQDRAIYDSAEDVLETILQDGMDDLFKEAAIYEWVIQNVEYDWRHADVMAEPPRESYTPYGGLVDHMAVCLGYATTFQLLSEMAGIECITVVGAALANKSDHAWNQVRLDGEWYCLDATWDLPYWEDGTMNGREWRYFNTTSDYMARTNHQWDYDNVPEATAEDHGRP